MPVFDPSHKTWFTQWSSYSPASSSSPDLDGDAEKTLLTSLPARPRSTSVSIHVLIAVVHFSVAVLWTAGFWMITPLCRPTPEILRPLEFKPAADAVEYQSVFFDVSGGGTRENPITDYEGPPTPEKDMKWYELINVGMMALTPEMNATLKWATQPAGEDDPTPLIQLDVFHQLHCLNAIRNIVYGTNKFYNPDDRQDQIHVDHCLDYIRQVLMCHSDVTPLVHKKRPEGYNPVLAPWVPNFYTEHTCRNFWKIHDWAAKYNTSGFVIETWPGLDPVAELRDGNLGHEHELEGHNPV